MSEQFTIRPLTPETWDAFAALVEYGFSPTAATLLIALATLLLGAALVWFGLSRLSAEKLAPTKTIHQLQKDASIVSDR